MAEESHLIKAKAFDMDEVPCTEVKEGLDSTDDEPEVEDIKDQKITSDNHTTCIRDDLTALKEVFDDETCNNLLIGFYDACSKCKIWLRGPLIYSHEYLEYRKIPNLRPGVNFILQQYFLLFMWN